MTKRLYCLSGGGLPGMDKHTGMLLGLDDLGLYPTTLEIQDEVACYIRGCSAGAGVGAFVASGKAASTIEAIIRGLSTGDVIDFHFPLITREAFLKEAMLSKPVEGMLAKYLPECFSDLKMPFGAFVTDVLTNRGLLLAESNLVTQDLRKAVRASMSIWGGFPLVDLPPWKLCDGGTKNNAALPRDWRDYDQVVMLICTDARHSKSLADATGLITLLIEGNMSLYAADQIDDAWDDLSEACPEMAAIGNGTVSTRDGWFEGRINGHVMRVLWLEPPMDSGSILKFNHDLIDLSRAYTKQVIKSA